MARRIDIELTSTRPDGTWTWRAAGAKAPKGVLDGALLHEGAKAGDVLKAEAEFEIEGITIISVATPKSEQRREPERIEVRGPGRPDGPGVTTQLVGRSDRRGPVRRRDTDQRGRPDRSRDASRGPDRRPATATDRPEHAERPDRPARQAGATSDRPERPGRGRPERPERRGRPVHDEGSNPASAAQDGRPVRGEPRRPVRNRTARPAERDTSPRSDARAKRLNPGHVHRQAILGSLAPEQQPIAEQVLRGGIPAVRTALHLEREKAVAEGRPEPNTDQLIAMAEDLLPRLKAADWRDRAEAAVKSAEEISLRDLRSVVAGADVARDEETRNLASTLREALERRVAGLRAQWSEEIAKHLDTGHVVRALRLSSRPPEPAARLDDKLATRLSEAAAESMSPEASPELWLALLDAATASPVRRTIKPVGLPSKSSPELRQAALQQSGRIPALAPMLGVSIPPPPTPVGRRPAPPKRRPAPPTTDTTPPPPADEAPAPTVDVSPEAEEIPAADRNDPPLETPSAERGQDPPVV